MPPRDGTVAVSSSSEATESENSCNDRYDYDKSSQNSIARRNSLPAASTVSCSSSEIDLRCHVSQGFEPPGYDFVVNPEFLVERNGETTQRSRIYCDQRPSDTAAKSTKASTPVPRSRTNSRFAESLDHLDTTRSRRNNRGKSTEYDPQHEHYMVPTHEPNRPNDNRTLSLFNPDFLPNFNDMLMYVARPDGDNTVPWDTREVSSYNVTDTSISRETALNNPAHTSTINSRYITRTSSPTRDPSYASLQLQDNRIEHVSSGFIENEKIYAAVLRQEAKRGCNTIEYNC